MRRSLIFVVMVFAVLMGCEGDLWAKSKKKKEVVTEAPAPVKKSPYEKFLSNKKLTREYGFATFYRDSKNLWLEIPDSLEGRKLILNTLVTSSSAPDIAVGKDLSSAPVYVLAFADSLVLFNAPEDNFVVSDGDSSIAAAIEKSKAGATLLALPVKCRNADSTARVVNVTKLFDEARKPVLDFKGVSYGDATVSEFARKGELTYTTGIEAFNESVAVARNITGSLTLKSMVGELAEKPTVTLDILTVLTLLPDKDVEKREADSRIGTLNVKYSSYSSTERVKSGSWAARHDISEGINVYVDTLFPASWTAAIKEGIEVWNEAFEAAGVGRPIRVFPYPKSFEACDPLASKVMACTGQGKTVSAEILTDKSTGEIISFCINVPGDYVTGVRRASICTISDVDPRYQKYDLPDDAVCDVLRADIMKVFGRCIGLTTNLAGSRAYSPEQLRNPVFTAEYGITASVMDGVVFNYFARPGDKEKGLVTIVDRLGDYDRFVVDWLYGDHDEEALDSLAGSGQAEYAYVPSLTRRAVKDSRALAADLGDDVFAAYEAGMEHVKYVAAHSDKWLDDSVPQDYVDLFIDYIWLRFNTLSSLLSSQVGSVEFHDVRQGSETAKMVPQSVEVQRKALKLFFEGFRDMSWFDSNKALLYTGGPNRDVGRFTLMNCYQLLGMQSLLRAVAMSHGAAGGDYTPEAFLEDVRKEVMAFVGTGKFSSGEDSMVAAYILSLISFSDVMKQNYKLATDPAGGKSFSAVAGFCGAETGVFTGETSVDGSDFTMTVSAVPDAWTSGLEALCYVSLGKVRTTLQNAVPLCSNDLDRRKIKYLISLADAGLGNR